MVLTRTSNVQWRILGFSGARDGLGDEGEGAGGGTPSRRGSGGLAPGKIFCK
jgi:hypothetical protein